MKEVNKTSKFDWKSLGWTSSEDLKEGDPSPRDGKPMKKYTGTVDGRKVTIYSSQKRETNVP